MSYSLSSWVECRRMLPPFKGVGSGIIEIALKYDKEAYRCVQAVQLGQKIYVLHALGEKI